MSFFGALLDSAVEESDSHDVQGYISCELGRFPVMVIAMAQQELKRQIGLFSAVMLIAGDMIGTGIFISTGVIAETLPSPGGVLLVWLLGGLLALTGALTFAELSASLPFAGGDYIYIREAYGKLMGFLSGWSSFLVTFSGAIAFLAVSLNGFMAFFFPVLRSETIIFSVAMPWLPITATAGTVFAIVVVLILSGLHCLGVRQGTMVQNILTILKIARSWQLLFSAFFLAKATPPILFRFLIGKKLASAYSLLLLYR